MEGDTESQAGCRGGDPESCDQPQSPKHRREKQRSKIQTLERPRVTQRPRAPSPELLKQTRDQGCGSPASLPLSLPSSRSRVSSPSCASSTHPRQNSLGPESLCPRTGTQPPPAAAGCACMHVCVCTCTRVLQCACATICVLFLAGAYNCTRPSQGHGHRHGRNQTHTQPLRNIQAHRHKEGRHNHTLKHRYTKAQAHTHLPLHTHTHCCPHFHWPRSCTPSYTCHTVSHTHSHPETCPQSPSLLIYTQGQKIHHAHNRSHLRKSPSLPFTLQQPLRGSQPLSPTGKDRRPNVSVPSDHTHKGRNPICLVHCCIPRCLGQCLESCKCLRNIG